MLKNKKHVFWQALFVTLLIFGIGLVFGIYLEQQRADDFNSMFFESESSLFDAIALINLLDSENLSCEDLINAHIDFADKIYFEARTLEKVDDSTKLTNSLKSIHKKYDLLRTILWINIIKVKENCKGVNSVVYLYEYSAEEISIRAEQNVWEKILFDLKQEEGANIILIPIAVDNDVASLDYLIRLYDVHEFPSVIINEDQVISEVSTTSDLKKYLD